MIHFLDSSELYNVFLSLLSNIYIGTRIPTQEMNKKNACILLHTSTYFYNLCNLVNILTVVRND